MKGVLPAGLRSLLIVIGGKSVGEIERLVGDGHTFGFFNISFVFQQEATVL